jgi:hypothetical protein
MAAGHMSPHKPKSATKRRRRTRALQKHGIRELPTPTRYHAFVEALEYRDECIGIRPSGRYLRKRNVTAELARLIQRWTRHWLKAKATGCRGGTDDL